MRREKDQTGMRIPGKTGRMKVEEKMTFPFGIT